MKRLVSPKIALALAFTMCNASTGPSSAEAIEMDLLRRLGTNDCQLDLSVQSGRIMVNRVKNTRLSADLFPCLGQLQELVALEVTTVEGPADRAYLRSLPLLSSLRELTLVGSEVNDEVIPYICGLTNLETLRLLSVSVAEEGQVHLAILTNLRRLDLSDLKLISVRGLRAIAALTNLNELAIYGDCEKGGLSELKSLSNLRTIWVGGTQMNQQLAELKALRSVKKVCLSRGTMTTGTVDSLLAMANLESLELECCKVEPKAGRRLQSLRLRELHCYGSSPAALSDLLRAISWRLVSEVDVR